MIVIRQGGDVVSIRRQVGDNCGMKYDCSRHDVGKVYINNYDTMDTYHSYSIIIVINEQLSYHVSVSIPAEQYIDSLLSQFIRDDKLEKILK
jgi:hypothetical protein